MNAVFRSKIDLWLVVLLIGIPVALVQFFLEDTGLDESSADLLSLGVVAATLIFCLWIYLSTRYTITAEALLVQSGPFSWLIPLREISSVEPTHNPASSPALSLDRLLIRYGSGAELMISPRDKSAFMTLLRKRIRDLSGQA